MHSIAYLCVSYLCLRIISSNSINTENYIDISCKNAFLICKIKYVGVNYANNESTTVLIKQTQNQNLNSEHFKIDNNFLCWLAVSRLLKKAELYTTKVNQ